MLKIYLHLKSIVVQYVNTNYLKGKIMKRAINVRLEENIILALEKLSNDLHTTKTDVIEKAIQLFSKQKNKKKSDLMQFAGILDKRNADTILQAMQNNKSSKDFTVDL